MYTCACVVPGKLPRVCSLQNTTLTYRIPGLGYGGNTQLTDVPGRYACECCTRTRGIFQSAYTCPGYCGTGIETLNKSRVRLCMSHITHRSSSTGNKRENNPNVAVYVQLQNTVSNVCMFFFFRFELLRTNICDFVCYCIFEFWN